MGCIPKRIPRLQNRFLGEGNKKTISKRTKDKDDKISISQVGEGIGREEEISRLRELNQLLITAINNSRQENASFLQKLTQTESHIHNIDGKFQSKMDNLQRELMAQMKVGERLNGGLKGIDKEFKELCQRKVEECRAAISEQLQDAEERFKKEIFDKEEECRAVVSDKRILESTVLELNGKIEVISAELEAAHRGWKLEKDELSSQIVAARQETEEIAKGSQMAEQAWNTDKDKFLSSLASYQKKIEEMSMENERILVQSRAEKIEMQSRLNEFKARAHELLEDKHLRVSEKEDLESNVAELQTKFDSFVSERGLLSQKNRELSTEVESLKSQLIELNAKLSHLEDEMERNEGVLHKCRAEKIDLQCELNESKEKIWGLLRKIEQDGHLWNVEKRNLEATVAELQTNIESMAGKSGLMNNIATMENIINSLQQQMNEGVEQRLDLTEQYKVTEHSLQQRNEILQEEVDRTRHLLEIQNQRVEELETALHSVNKDLESKERQPLQGRSLVLVNAKSKLNDSLENRKPKPNHEHESKNGKPNPMHESENGKPNSVIEKINPKSNVLTERRTTNRLLEKATPPPKPVGEKRASAMSVSESWTSSELVSEKQTPNKVPGKRTPKQLSRKQSPNIGPQKPWR